MVVVESHLSVEDVAAYVDRRLPRGDRDRVELHLSVCKQCRDEVAEVTRLASSGMEAPRPRRSRLTVVAAAAAVLLVVSLTIPRLTSYPESREERSDTTPGGNRVISVEPRDNAVVARERTFTWRRDDNAAYQVRIVDSAGGVVWTGGTTDTTLVLPANVRMTPATKYFWYVDALRADGFSVSSGPRPFSTAP
jgi:anti-sigma factor RsiW